jgi:ribosomal-protein-alanine N-acetyltransferase
MSSPQIPGFVVRPVVPKDSQAWAMYACLPEVKEFTSSTATSVEDLLAIINRTIVGEPHSPIQFALIPVNSITLIATVGFHSISPQNRTAEITFDVAPSQWGKGIATAACRAATLWAFAAKGWQRIQATTIVPHIRSQRVLERCGYKKEGLVRNFRVVRGEATDYWLYSAIPGEIPDDA